MYLVSDFYKKNGRDPWYETGGDRLKPTKKKAGHSAQIANYQSIIQPATSCKRLQRRCLINTVHIECMTICKMCAQRHHRRPI